MTTSKHAPGAGQPGKQFAAEKIRGLYAVTPDKLPTAQLLAQVRAALRGGAQVLQYRNKTASAALRHEQATALVSLCTEYNIPLIVNDDLELALAIGAAGLHIGESDGDIAAVRAALGGRCLLGVSCYDQLVYAQSAAAAGADYLAFGSIFLSGTKPAARRASLDLFSAAAALGKPLVGIGGITRVNLPELVAAGASAAAVIGELFGDGDLQGIQARAEVLSACFGNVTQ